VENRQQALTPQELTGNPDATLQQATFIRHIFRKAGINVDAKMLDYYRAVEEAKANGLDPDSVDLFSTAESNSLQLTFADEVNKASFSNRPEALTLNEYGRNFGLFLGYPLWQNTKWAVRASRNSREEASIWEARMLGLKWLVSTIVVGGVGGSMARALSALAFDEERSEASPVRKASEGKIGEAGWASLMQSRSFMPITSSTVMWFANQVAEAADSGDPSIKGPNLVPFAWFESFSKMLNGFARGRFWDSLADYQRQWWPNHKVWTNRLPSREGMVEMQNVIKILKANKPKGVKIDPGNFIGSPSGKAGEYRNHVISALMRADEPDWELVERERRLGIEEKKEAGVSNPERSFDDSVLDYNPTERVNQGKKVSEQTHLEWMQSLSSSEREQVENAERRLEAYASMMGRPFVPWAAEERVKPAKNPYETSSRPKTVQDFRSELRRFNRSLPSNQPRSPFPPSRR